jgi:hypothetical protein
MRFTRYTVAAFLMLLPVASQAQNRSPPFTPAEKPITLSTSPQLVAAANQNRIAMSIQNLDATIEVCYSWTDTTPTCGAAGTFTVIGKSVHFWPAASVPNSALYMIAASGTPAVTVQEGN